VSRNGENPTSGSTRGLREGQVWETGIRPVGKLDRNTPDPEAAAPRFYSTSMRIKLKLIPILFLLIVNCAYVTISRTDYIYESKTIKNTELNNRFSLEFDLRHSTAEEIYFAKDTIPDSIYRLDFPDRQEYYKRVKYRNVSRGIACGHNTINRLEVNDTSKIRLIGIKLEMLNSENTGLILFLGILAAFRC